MIIGVKVNHVVSDTGTIKCSAGVPRDRSRQVKDTHDGSSHDGLGGCLTTANRVGSYPTLAIRRSSEGHDRRRSGDRVHDLSCVADGPDMRVGGSLLLIDDDRTSFRELKSTLSSQPSGRPNANAHEHDVSAKSLTIGEHHVDT